jgi:hypothetical protein
MSIPITSLDQFKREASRDGGLNAFVALSGGGQSSKLFSRHATNDSWSVLHEIDDREVIYPSTERMLAAEPAVAQALESGALHAHWIDEDAELPEDLVI